MDIAGNQAVIGRQKPHDRAIFAMGEQRADDGRRGDVHAPSLAPIAPRREDFGPCQINAATSDCVFVIIVNRYIISVDAA